MISKEASQLLCLAFQNCQENLESLANKLMTKESLLKLANSAVKILAENGHSAILAVLENCPSVKYIPKICDELSSKNPLMKIKCSFYLLHMINFFPIKFIEKQSEIMENAMILSINDANKETRSNGRKCFICYQEKFPLRSEKIFNKFDQITQKYILEESVQESDLTLNNSFSPSKTDELFFKKKATSRNELESPEYKKKRR